MSAYCRRSSKKKVDLGGILGRLGGFSVMSYHMIYLIISYITFFLRIYHISYQSVFKSDTDLYSLVRRHVKQGKTWAVNGVGRLKYSSLVSVKACQGFFSLCQGVKILSPDRFDEKTAPLEVRQDCGLTP